MAFDRVRIVLDFSSLCGMIFLTTAILRKCDFAVREAHGTHEVVLSGSDIVIITQLRTRRGPVDWL